MCGIAGLLHFGRQPDAAERVRGMARSIRHRGPDDEGYWQDDSVALGFVRLSILDIAGGHQPMSNEDGSVWTIFNGEIYNHRDLRRELERCGHRFSTDHSDTEVLVHGWEQWGERLTDRLNGMFAFAVWDSRSRALFLARDRYGIKPLYKAALAGGEVLFASEIRAIHASGLLGREADADGLMEYLSQQNLWSGRTCFAGVEEFPPGTRETIDARAAKRVRYWDYSFPRGSRASLATAAAQHREILSRVIRRQAAADVPVMTYLSGGIDSSSIAAAAHQLDPGMAAYSCIFQLDGVGDDAIVDEREFSRSMAAYLGIRHIQLEVPQDALASSIDQTIRALETPRMGMSYVNFLIAQRVSRDGKVVLSGTGGDELHGGYVYRYRAVKPEASPLPHRLRQRVKRLLHGRGTVPPNGDAVYFQMLNFPIPVDRVEQALTPEFRRQVKSYDPRESIGRMLSDCPYEDPWDRVLWVDARTYLHGLLVLEDKLSMASSLEARVPLLDNELVDFVSNLPWRLLFDGDTGKIVFRESVRHLVPDTIYRKPKMGFGPPDASWYRGVLRPFIASQLSPDRVARRGVFQPQYVEAVLNDHFSGRANNVAIIWSMLSLKSWCREFGLLGGDGAC